MIELTNNQIEMIYEMTEIHFKWFEIYTPEDRVTFEEVLRLNHRKMLDITDACTDCTEEMINFMFESTIREYKEMLNDYNPN